MKIRLSYALVFLFLASLIVTVSATGYTGEPIITAGPHITITPLTPGLGGGAVTGGFTLKYPDGSPVELSSNTVSVQACGTRGCVTVQVTLTPGSTPGTYAYSFTYGSNFPTGTVTLTVPAGSMTDSFGKSFPSVNTVIGTLTNGSSSSTSVPASNGPNLAKASPASSSPQLIRVAQTTLRPQTTPDYTIISVIALLSLLGIGLLLYPSRLL